MKHPLLIVDDDPLILDTLGKSFASRETEIYSARDPEKAKEIMGKIVPELVVLDLLLTKENGSQKILDFMKSKEELQHVPVLVLTNLDNPELKQALLSQGVKEYIVKGTLSLDQLAEKVRSYLEPNTKTPSTE